MGARETNTRAALAEKAGKLLAARAAKTAAMAETAAMETRAAAAEKEAKSAEEEKKLRIDHTAGESAIRLGCDLPDSGLGHGDLPEYEMARGCFEAYGEEFPAWVNQSAAESGFGPRFLESCVWVLDRKEEDQI